MVNFHHLETYTIDYLPSAMDFFTATHSYPTSFVESVERRSPWISRYDAKPKQCTVDGSEIS